MSGFVLTFPAVPVTMATLSVPTIPMPASLRGIPAMIWPAVTPAELADASVQGEWNWMKVRILWTFILMTSFCWQPSQSYFGYIRMLKNKIVWPIILVSFFYWTPFNVTKLSLQIK